MWLLLSATSLFAQEEVRLHPFTMDHRKAVLAQSPAHVSFLLDAPGGKRGFVRAQGAHLVTCVGAAVPERFGSGDWKL
jgi:hypothetical protein